MAACFRLLGAEGRPEAVDLAERSHIRLVVKLAGLRQIGWFAKIVDLKQRGRIFPGGRGEDGRVDQQVAVIVQPVADRANDRRPDAQNRPLAQRPHPQVAVIHQEFDAVILGLDRIFSGLLDQLEFLDADLEPARIARCAFIRSHNTRHFNR